jgi:hypothetical protein
MCTFAGGVLGVTGGSDRRAGAPRARSRRGRRRSRGSAGGAGGATGGGGGEEAAAGAGAAAGAARRALQLDGRDQATFHFAPTIRVPDLPGHVCVAAGAQGP